MKRLFLFFLLSAVMGAVDAQGIRHDVPASGPVMFRTLFWQDTTVRSDNTQGMAIWGDRLFQFQDGNKPLMVYSFPDGRPLARLELEPVKTWHNNNVNFSSIYYKEGDKYPLLYAGQENVVEHKAVVWRITESGEGCFAAEIVQTLHFPDPVRMGLYYPNIVLDVPNGKLYLTGFSRKSWKDASSGNGIQILRFPLPSVKAGREVTLTTDDIEERFCGDFRVATQGAVIRDGRLYQVFGVPKYGATRLVCTDLSDGRVLFVSELGGVSGEPEGLDFWQGRLVVTTNQGGVYWQEK